MTHRTNLSMLTLAGLLATFSLPGCPSSASLCDDGACEPAVDGGGTDADGDVAQLDKCLSRPQAPECMTEETSLFVSAAGDGASGDGTKANPLTSIGAALDRITEGRKRIYVCDGTYPEAVLIGAKHSGGERHRRLQL